ncbi:MAG: hypothetical protein HC859_13425 [Bacteroidia bacterium]|nr:hypothetical protein [Bacteroidia bacterium]
MVTGKHNDLDALLALLATHLEAGYLKLKQHGPAALQAEYAANLYWRNERRTFLYRGASIEGTIHDVDESGRLCIEHNGARIFADLKELKYIA